MLKRKGPILSPTPEQASGIAIEYRFSAQATVDGFDGKPRRWRIG
jgi:hypothetical protein